MFDTASKCLAEPTRVGFSLSSQASLRLHPRCALGPARRGEMPARLTAGIREQGARRSCGDLGGPTPSRVRNWLRKAEVSVVQGPKTAAEGTTRRVRTRLPGRKRRFSKSPSWDLEQQRLDRRDNCRVQERIPRGKRAPWAPRSSRMKRTTAEVQGPRGPSWPQSVG